MAKIIYWTWSTYLKLLYMSWNFYRKYLNVLLQNLMRMEDFEICVFKVDLKNNIWETTGPIMLKFCMLSICKIRIRSVKIIKFWKVIWQFQNSLKSDPVSLQLRTNTMIVESQLFAIKFSINLITDVNTSWFLTYYAVRNMSISISYVTEGACV